MSIFVLYKIKSSHCHRVEHATALIDLQFALQNPLRSGLSHQQHFHTYLFRMEAGYEVIAYNAFVAPHDFAVVFGG
jgi:hypothetical protein